MRPPLVTVLLLFYSYNTCQCGSTSSLVEIACRRQPSLSFCHTEESARPPALPSSSRAKDTPLSANDRLIMEDIADSVKKAGGNPFEKKRVPREELEDKKDLRDSDLRDKDSDSEGFIPEEGENHQETARAPSRTKEDSPKEELPSSSTPLPEATTEDTEEHTAFRGGKGEYCDNYEQHFSFYCVGEHSSDGNEDTLAKFCTSYMRACPNKAITSKSPLTVWPTDPFSTKTRIPARAKEVSQEKSEEAEVTEQELYNAELKRRFPCKPDCDHRLFPHCTAECKCDYLYPAVQRFCNPPPMPMFLNTCRLWYNGCPKYEAYHYASQFVYSKAEKGKVLPGPQANNPNPYNIPQPTLTGRPFRTEGAPTQLRPLARASVTSPDLVLPPDLPKNFEEVMENRKIEKDRIDVFERTQKKQKTKRTHRKKKATVTTKAPLTTRELYKGLKALNALTTDPVKLTQDIVGQGAGGDKAKARGSSNFPVVPSDAAYGTDEGFNRFDSLTDSRGILHRPRSRSPFTKPGLWEANPDDPHNRDHANKYYYHPRSVGVDWLNGQMTWGAHWAVPAAGVGGTDGFSALHFPSIGTFLNIPDDYD